MSVEILFVDDHSEDGSREILSKERLPGMRILNNDGLPGKKSALMTGLQAATGGWILQTDADCVLPEKWVETYQKKISAQPEHVMITGPVVYGAGKSWLTPFFKLDFLSLVVTGAGLMGAGRPVYCNGANMAYRKEDVLALTDPFNQSVSSGDDVFLLQQLAKEHPGKVSFLKDREALVTTSPPESLLAFLRQRARWGGKAVHYQGWWAKLTALWVYSVNVALIIVWAGVCAGHTEWESATVFTAFKFLADAIILIIGTSFFMHTALLIALVPALIFYPFYITLTPMLFWSSSGQWNK